MSVQALVEDSKHSEVFKTKVLLVDDQPIIAEAVKGMIKNEQDIEFYYCENPVKAIEMANEIHPTLILQDLVLPDVDGLVLVKYFRANPLTKEIPLIVLSTKEDPKIKAEAFALGANDYLVKLPDKIEFVARLRYHSAGYIRLLERNDAYARLAEKQNALNKELLEAAEYVRSLLPEPIQKGNVEADWRFYPSTQLGGDAFGYHWLDDRYFAIYLLDVCGHGVGAALHSISLMNVIRSRNLSHADFYNPVSVLRGLNQAFPMEKHNNMFFSIWYGVYDRKARMLQFSSGGHPPALLFTPSQTQSMLWQELHTPGLVIGAGREAEYISRQVAIENDASLLLYSDGVYEIQEQKGNMLQWEDYVALIKKSFEENRKDLKSIVDISTKINDSKSFQDDFSIIQIHFKCTS